MAVSERARRMLYDRLEEVLGVGQGDVLMEYLPPSGWSEVATRSDLNALEQRLESRFARIDDRFERIEDRFDGRFEGVDDRFDQLLAQIDGRFAQQTAEITAAFRGEIITAMTLQTRQTVFAIIGVLLATAALVAAVLGLG